MARTTHRTARALAYGAACMLLAVLSAQVSATSVGRGLGFFYDPAKEVTLVGTVKQIVPRSAANRAFAIETDGAQTLPTPATQNGLLFTAFQN
jgi:hypothetical protein